MQNKVKLLIVDDSPVFRAMLTGNLADNPNIEVVGTASDAFEASDKIRELSPDVLILDIEMPKMDGREFLQRLMSSCPMPCIMVTASDVKEKDVLDAGAAGFMKKPKGPADTQMFCSILGTKAILAAGTSRFTAIRAANLPDEKVDGVFSPSASVLRGRLFPNLPLSEEIPLLTTRDKEGYVVALGASTGGTDALECVIKSFPDNMPPVVVVQHMPAGFTKMYADRLDKSCAVTVREACDGDRLRGGLCLIGAGGFHLELKKDAEGYYVRCRQGEKVSGHCPSVDVLFSSVAEAAGKKAVGAIMTGMGADGAKGLLKMHNSGAYTIGQDKETCVVYGMPMEAYKLGACSEQQPIHNIGAAICSRLAAGWDEKDALSAQEKK